MKTTTTNNINRREGNMTGSEKQIEYAETLRTNLFNRINIEQGEKLPLRMFVDPGSDELRTEQFEALKKFSGYAGHLIDAIKMETWSLRVTTVGYHNFMKTICGYKRVNKQWVK